MTLPYDTVEIDVAARTIAGEAGSSRLSQAAREHVAWVIRNRVEADIGADGKPDWWGEGIVGVCKRANKAGVHQFSCWNASDPNAGRIAAMSRNSPAFQACLRAAMTVFALDKTADPTKGATHYCALTLHPEWASGLVPVLSDDAHKFFNNVK